MDSKGRLTYLDRQDIFLKWYALYNSFAYSYAKMLLKSYANCYDKRVDAKDVVQEAWMWLLAKPILEQDVGKWVVILSVRSAVYSFMHSSAGHPKIVYGAKGNLPIKVGKLYRMIDGELKETNTRGQPYTMSRVTSFFPNQIFGTTLSGAFDQPLCTEHGLTGCEDCG